VQSAKLYKIMDKEIWTAVATSDHEIRNFSSVVDYLKEEKDAKVIFGIGVFPRSTVLVSRKGRG
jgi:hypothetical protein